MAHALRLAVRAGHTTRPNPAVGAVVVRDGVVVGEGFTRPVGGPHAEVVALADAGDAARGATVYVTLEPCRHQGRTPPCTDALIAAGVGRVVYGSADPGVAAGGGSEVLRRADVEVTAGVLRDWTDEHHRSFLAGVGHPTRPNVTLKLAQTPAGTLSRPGGGWITGPEARKAVHERRGMADGVLVGSGTVLADNPRLDVRDVLHDGPQPVPIVLDARGRTPLDARVVRPGAVIVTTAHAHASFVTALEAAGVHVHVVAPAREGGVDLVAALAALRSAGLDEILAEPGRTLAEAMVHADVVDTYVQHIASPGDDLTSAVPVLGTEATSSWPVATWRRLGSDIEVVRHRPT